LVSSKPKIGILCCHVSLMFGVQTGWITVIFCASRHVDSAEEKEKLVVELDSKSIQPDSKPSAKKQARVETSVAKTVKCQHQSHLPLALFSLEQASRVIAILMRKKSLLLVGHC
jgi:hypothetical protein